jgi:hypothetical protein
MHGIGSRSRVIIDSSGKLLRLIIRRLRCSECGKIHHELPDIVMPYKRHCIATIEKVVAGKEEAVCCEESTIRRIRQWWLACQLYFRSVLASLREKYGVSFCDAPSPKETVRAVANAQLWPHTRSAFLSAGAPVMLMP